MILTNQAIKAAIAAGHIVISPYNEAAVGPDSYDLVLGPKIIRHLDPVVDAKKPVAIENLVIPESGLHLKAGDFVLGHSAESISSDHYAALIHARSSVARLGLFVHVTSDLIHVGSSGNITFQLYATMPVVIYAGMRIAQITFWQPKGDIMLYRGKYRDAVGPQPSRLYEDFK